MFVLNSKGIDKTTSLDGVLEAMENALKIYDKGIRQEIAFD